MSLIHLSTGYDDTQKAEIENAAKETAVFFTYNMSMGINLLATLAKKATAVLGLSLIHILSAIDRVF